MMMVHRAASGYFIDSRMNDPLGVRARLHSRNERIPELKRSRKPGVCGCANAAGDQSSILTAPADASR
jgi:hypothetical protein